MKLKVGSYNIQHGCLHPHRLAYGDEVIDLSLMAYQIKAMELDFCGLNEVRNHENLDGGVNQAKEIGKILGFDYRFGKAIDWNNGAYGNAFVTRLPIISCECIPVMTDPSTHTEGGYENRVLMKSEISVGDGIVTFMCIHFGLKESEQDEAVRIIKEEVKKCSTPVVLMGDFNITPDSPHYSELCTVLTDASSVTDRPLLSWPSDVPVMKIDYIFVSADVKVLSTDVPAVCVSDHRPIIAEIEI